MLRNCYVTFDMLSISRILLMSRMFSDQMQNSYTFIGAANNATVQKVFPGVIAACATLIYIVDRVLLPNATLASIPGYVASGASAVAIAGQWAFALSSALAAALLLVN